MKVLKTRRRTIITSEIGKFHAHETQLICDSCSKIYSCEELTQRVPDQSNVGFDVLIDVGKSLFIRCCSQKEIQSELREKNIMISLREIGYLGKKFIVYLALLHRESQNNMKQFLSSQGGYILHLDATCEGDSPHLMSAQDSLSEIVLHNVKLPSENAQEIVPFLQQIEEAYGKPIALVHDMGSGILSAVKIVFPGIADFICHFHFLRDIGKDLFGLEYSSMRNAITTYRLRNHLRQAKKDLKQIIDADQELNESLKIYLRSHHSGKPQTQLREAVSAYVLIIWVLEAKNELNGFGFPFDQEHFVFYQRLEEAHPLITNLRNRSLLKKPLSPLFHAFKRTLNDPDLQKSVAQTRKKVEIFNQLREAMRIALPENKKGLNDDGEETFNLQTIRYRVIEWRLSEEIERLASEEIAYKKMLKQIDKYWPKLFADPIEVTTASGTISIQPRRTNNILERFFRNLKRGWRKKSGTHSLSKTIKTMIAHTPLVKNLENPQYMKILLGEKTSLAERFAEIDSKLVRQELKEQQKQLQKLPTGMKEVSKIKRLPAKLAGYIIKRVAS